MAIRLLLFDTSILIPMIREKTYEDLFQRALQAGRARLSSVVMQELYAGTRTPSDKKNYDRLNRTFLSQGHMIVPNHDDWILSGILLAQYQQRYGAVEPQDHINDILIALSAVRASATLVTENTIDMERWQKMLRRSGKLLNILAPRKP